MHITFSFLGYKLKKKLKNNKTKKTTFDFEKNLGFCTPEANVRP